MRARELWQQSTFATFGSKWVEFRSARALNSFAPELPKLTGSSIQMITRIGIRH